ncbi:hypothetical protein KP003_07665 [Geomonas nitrogeniifigens]|uniref:Uncharacterized protein n=1 Tax=Geomonas diazotrophica TaxID=2843197 RepID=A0ABX8JR43_9BACT|nr:hypothetical protein [Geomonas nitrogeniifigens]QWV99099.1 hypothetical protein KP005_07410 [Geomonas nitrogeniifigens]QXE88267.1 hypothetical protein KP003_07665 [Geomonas nitrogeniifigens]
MLKYILIMLLLAATPAYSETEAKDIAEPPHFTLMGSIGNNSAMAMKCYGEAPFQEIDCAFTQVMISATSAKDLAERKVEAIKELEKVQRKEIQELKKELSGTGMEKFQNRMKNATPEQQAYAQDLVSVIKAITLSKDKTSLKKALLDQQDIEGSTCSITLNTFDLHFSRISKNKWLYNPGPTGLCNVVRVSTLENSEAYPELWTYSQNTVTADKDPVCQKWVEVGATMVTSWDSPKAFKFEQCKYIQFGH